MRVAAWVLLILLLSTGAWAEVVPQNPADAAEREVLAEIEEVQPIEPTAEELIVSAMEIYSWFTISPLDVDPELVGGEGDVWRVADETLCEYEYMASLLTHTFSAEIIEGMLAYDVYTVIDGMLYTVPGGRNIDQNISWVEYEDVFCTETMNVIVVTVHYLGETEFGIVPDVFEFVRERTEDDVWLFTQFPFFW